MDGQMTATDQGRARQALAFLAQTLRPDWDPPGIVAAIEALHRDRQPLGVIAKATIAAALTPTTKTPGGISARIRDGWTGDEHVQPPTPTPDRLADMRCPNPRCGVWVVRGETHRCDTPVDPERTHELAAAARAEIRGTVTYESEETPDGDE